MKLFVCDYINPDSRQMESFVLEVEDDDDVEADAVQYLKSLGIPKRYLVNVEEF